MTEITQMSEVKQMNEITQMNEIKQMNEITQMNEIKHFMNRSLTTPTISTPKNFLKLLQCFRMPTITEGFIDVSLQMSDLAFTSKVNIDTSLIWITRTR